jgi:DNA-binding transcriptional MocR family regulator
MMIRFSPFVLASLLSLSCWQDGSEAFTPSQSKLSGIRRYATESTDPSPSGASAVATKESIDELRFSPGEATLRLGINTGPTVWTEFSRIGNEHNPVNLGQGFPDWLPPKFATDCLVEAVLDSAQSPHQYTRSAGHPNLVKQLATRYSTHMNREIDPMSEVAVTVGASQALYLSLQTLVKPGM